MKVTTRTPMAAHEIARLAEKLAAGEISVRDMVIFNEEEVTEEKLEAKQKETLKLAAKVAEAHHEYLLYRKHFLKLNRRSPRYVKAKWRLGRLRIDVSQAIRRFELAEAVKRRMVERIRESVVRIRDADEKIGKLESKLKHKLSDDYKKQLRREIHDQRQVLRGIQFS
jgi:RNA polymerase primary sigma factor